MPTLSEHSVSRRELPYLCWDIELQKGSSSISLRRIYKKRVKIFKNKESEKFYKEYFKLDEFKKVTVRYILKRKQRHKFHIVAPSPWPVYSSSSAFLFVMGMIFWIHTSDPLILYFGLVTIGLSFYFWFKDIVREGLYMGYHTRIVEKSLRLGFTLFLTAEFLFFFSFLAALFYFWVGGDGNPNNIWPPEGVVHHLFDENLNDVYNKISFHRDSYMRLLSPFYNDSIFTQLFCQKKHFLDYHLNKSTLISFSTINDGVHFIFGENVGGVALLPYEWLYLNLATYYLEPKADEIPCCFSPYQNYERLLWPPKIINLESERKTKLMSSNNFEEIYPASYFFQWIYNGNLQMTEFQREPILRITSFSSGLLINAHTTPLLNVVLLLTISAYLSAAHRALNLEYFTIVKIILVVTIILGIIFIYLQLQEFFRCGLSINDGIYGSLFFVLTGFHGIHVIVGTLFLIVCCMRLFYSHFTAGNHFAFEAAVWYWLVADLIWILLFFTLYLWPSSSYFDGHRVDIIFHKCVEFFQPEIHYSVNIKETLYYYSGYITQHHPQYCSIVLGSESLPFSRFLTEQHWSLSSTLPTPRMGIYFTTIFFQSLGQASKNLFFFEVLYTTFAEIETFLWKYFNKYYDWVGNKFIADHFEVGYGGFLKSSYNYLKVQGGCSEPKSALLSTVPVKISFCEKPIVYEAPPQYWTCFVNKRFSCNSIDCFYLTPRSNNYFYKNYLN